MKTIQIIQKWGNSSGIRLSKQILEAANLEADDKLAISLRGNSIVLTPVRDKDELTLDSMLAGVTPDNVHLDVIWQTEVGAEIVDD